MKITNLRPADVLVYDPKPEASWTAKGISVFQWVTGNGYGASSHISEVSSNINIEYESTWPVSRRHVIGGQDGVDFEHYKIRVFRYPRELTIEEINKGHDWYEKHLGVRYDVACIATFTLIDFPCWLVCSEFVGLGWKARGIELNYNRGNLLSPNEIVNGGVLEEIGELER